jgi:hypothetical protein
LAFFAPIGCPLVEKKKDPTKDPEFQKVVSHFLKTPPKRHLPKPAPKRKKAKRKDGT